MNMKKLFGIIVLAMLAVCSTVLVSCGDDEEEAILGTWRNTYEYQGRTTGYWQITFLPNGTYVEMEVNYSYPNNDWEGGGLYTIKGNKLTMYASDGDGGTYVYTFTISGTTLTLTDSDGDSEVFTRQ